VGNDIFFLQKIETIIPFLYRHISL